MNYLKTPISLLVFCFLLRVQTLAQPMRGPGIWLHIPLGPETELGEPGLALNSSRRKLSALSIGSFRFRLSRGLSFDAYYRPRPGPPDSIRFWDARYRYLAFLFEEGDTRSRPSAQWARDHFELILLDTEGKEVSHWPDYVHLRDGRDGSVWRFDMRREGDAVFGGFLSVTQEDGRVITIEDLGYDIRSVERGPWTFIYQVKSPDRLTVSRRIDADRVEVSQYALGDVTGKNDAGFYELKEDAQPFLLHIVENPNPMMDDEFMYTRIADGRVVDRQFYLWDENRRNYIRHQTPVTQGHPRFFEEEIQLEDGVTFRREIWFQEEGSEEKLNRYAEHRLWIPGLEAERVVRTETGSGDRMEVTETQFYMDPEPPGRQGKRKSRLRADGSWEAWDYDAEGRMILSLRSPPRIQNLEMTAERSEALEQMFGDLLEAAPEIPAGPPENPSQQWRNGHAHFFDYAPNHPGDDLSIESGEPRRVTEYRDGSFISRTWTAFYPGENGETVRRTVETRHEDAEVDDPRNRQSFQ